MKQLIHYKNIYFTAHYLWLFLAIMVTISLLSSCNKDDLDIQKGFPFEVEVMPVADEIASGHTIEMRFSIQRTDHFIGKQYFIRYFQSDGQGTLQYYDEPVYIPNDLYPLKSQEFRLYYTSQSVISQSFDVWISDNFGNEKKLSFQFNSAD